MQEQIPMYKKNQLEWTTTTSAGQALKPVDVWEQHSPSSEFHHGGTNFSS
ncbi:hypothetical protein KC19_12G080400 [Ceratodon purpureus]|uniref:Uncharacterized protein n=1 Tax=Ceratodon purpureus TaxID=3225 RepID=A0A8T0G7C4_CERPU|nr:hypothetical protein KC19_12G080400 [Ceratodon purpureus]